MEKCKASWKILAVPSERSSSKRREETHLVEGNWVEGGGL